MARKIKVIIAHLQKGMITVTVDANSTVGQVLEQASITATEEVFLNSKPAKLGSKVKAGDTIGVVVGVDGGTQ